MDLTLSRRGDYVLRAAICLAASWDKDGRYSKIRTVAAKMALPASYTPQMLGLLAKAGIAESRAGRSGGYRLSRPPRRVSVLEVVEAAEGHLISERCPLRGGPCHWDDVCPAHPTWIKASEAIRATLARTSLADVATVDRRLGEGAAITPPPPGHRRGATRSRRSSPARTDARSKSATASVAARAPARKGRAGSGGPREA